MQTLLSACQDHDPTAYEAGRDIIVENEKTGHLYVLLKGTMEVYRDDVSIAIVNRPGTVVGEMGLLLDIPHTASVRALEPCEVYVIEDGLAFLEKRSDAVLPIARLLAERLRNANTYLVDLKRQFQDQANHFGMVDQVLESLSHQPDSPPTSGVRSSGP